MKTRKHCFPLWEVATTWARARLSWSLQTFSKMVWSLYIMTIHGCVHLWACRGWSGMRWVYSLIQSWCFTTQTPPDLLPVFLKTFFWEFLQFCFSVYPQRFYLLVSDILKGNCLPPYLSITGVIYYIVCVLYLISFQDKKILRRLSIISHQNRQQYKLKSSQHNLGRSTKLRRKISWLLKDSQCYIQPRGGSALEPLIQSNC